MIRQISVIELFGFYAEDDVQDFFNDVLAQHKWEKANTSK